MERSNKTLNFKFFVPKGVQRAYFHKLSIVYEDTWYDDPNDGFRSGGAVVEYIWYEKLRDVNTGKVYENGKMHVVDPVEKLLTIEEALEKGILLKIRAAVRSLNQEFIRSWTTQNEVDIALGLDADGKICRVVIPRNEREVKEVYCLRWGVEMLENATWDYVDDGERFNSIYDTEAREKLWGKFPDVDENPALAVRNCKGKIKWYDDWGILDVENEMAIHWGIRYKGKMENGKIVEEVTPFPYWHNAFVFRADMEYFLKKYPNCKYALIVRSKRRSECPKCPVTNERLLQLIKSVKCTDDNYPKDDRFISTNIE